MARLTDVLTPEKILAIYQETGLRPAFGGFYPEGTAPKDCYCPMGALAMSKDPRILKDPNINQRMVEAFELDDANDIWDFISGFDDDVIEGEPTDAYLLGRKTRNFLQIHYGPLVDLSNFPSDSVSGDDD